MFPASLGHVAYEKWSESQERMTANWEDLPQEGKKIWNDVAKSVLIAHGYSVSMEFLDSTEV